MVDDLFSENPTTRALALRKTRQLMMDFPDRLMFNVVRIKTPPKLVGGMKIFGQAYLNGMEQIFPKITSSGYYKVSCRPFH